MAALVSSLSFLTPFCALQSLIQKMHPRKLSVDRLSTQATTATASELLAPCISNRGILCVNRSYHHRTTALSTSRHVCEVVSCSNAGYCIPLVITGYWVGPDIDDGWGFVEAFVYQIP